MVLVSQDQLQAVTTYGQIDLGFGLTGAKVEMIEVIRYRLIEWRQAGIDHQMMVARIQLFETSGGHAHPDKSETDDGRWFDVRTILGINEIDLRARWRWMTSRARRCLSRRRSSRVRDVNTDAV
jgi:hypothetical protein